MADDKKFYKMYVPNWVTPIQLALLSSVLKVIPATQYHQKNGEWYARHALLHSGVPVTLTVMESNGEYRFSAVKRVDNANTYFNPRREANTCIIKEDRDGTVHWFLQFDANSKSHKMPLMVISKKDETRRVD